MKFLSDTNKKNYIFAQTIFTHFLGQYQFFTKIGTYHSHPSGDEENTFDQHPSPEDYQNAINREQQYGMKGTNMFFGMKDKNVYLYNSKGNKATISLSIF